MLQENHVISRYIQRSVLSAVSRNRGRSWNVLSADTGVCLYSIQYSNLVPPNVEHHYVIFIVECPTVSFQILTYFIFTITSLSHSTVEASINVLTPTSLISTSCVSVTLAFTFAD